MSQDVAEKPEYFFKTIRKGGVLRLGVSLRCDPSLRMTASGALLVPVIVTASGGGDIYQKASESWELRMRSGH